MMTLEDINRITDTDTKIERLINNAVTACKGSTSDWAKNYWFGVFTKLCRKYKRMDLYRKHLH